MAPIRFLYTFYIERILQILHPLQTIAQNVMVSREYSVDKTGSTPCDNITVPHSAYKFPCQIGNKLTAVAQYPSV